MNSILAGGGFVLNIVGELLLIFRNGRWDLPKGKLEAGESIAQCALREVCEECGLELKDLKLGDQLLETVHFYHDTRMGDVEKRVVWFVMHYTGSSTGLHGQIEEGIERAEWVSMEKAEELLADSYDTIKDVYRAGLATVHSVTL